MGVWSSVKNALSSAAHAVGKAFSSAENDISSDAHAVATKIGTATTTVYNDVKGAGKAIYQGGQNLTNKVVDDVKGTIDNTVNKTTSIISLPLILIAGAAVVFAYNSRGNFQASYNK